mmetsp:Transcript_1079/g.2116  ORF Transcript_1079/g.2116 Transcript_1079/m.2116 type:complete len:258 (-) Transcript_1079:629-1402(-)
MERVEAWRSALESSDGIVAFLLATRVSWSCWKMGASACVRNVHAVPLRPARPVRPMRCTYGSILDGMSKLITWFTFGTSIPRPSTSVATKHSYRPVRNPLMLSSRTACALPECIDTHRSLLLLLLWVASWCSLMKRSVWSQPLFVLTNTMIGGSHSRSNCTRRRFLASSDATNSTRCVTLSVERPISPTATVTASLKYACASRSTPLDMVAENIIVCRSSCSSGSMRSTACTCGSKPMSSMRSASSSTSVEHWWSTI